MIRYALSRVATRSRVRRKVVQRLTEPLHLNLLSLFVAAFGTYRAKVAFDLVVRQQYAFSILHAADVARRHGVGRVTALEFGVFRGDGLRNLCRVAAATTRATGVEFDVVGFDSGGGLPPPVDHRDHPELWRPGTFQTDLEAVRRSLPPNGHLVVGDVNETVPEFVRQLSPEAPLGFIAVDVDLYSSAKACLNVLSGPPDRYLPTVGVYLDDITSESANPWCGELLAVHEFNEQYALRKIAPYPFLRHQRLFKNVAWIDKTFTAHILDHPARRAPRDRTEYSARTVKPAASGAGDVSGPVPVTRMHQQT